MSKLTNTCTHCQGHITSTNGGNTWRHTAQPVDNHAAHTDGTPMQIDLTAISREAADGYNALFGL